MEKNLVEDYCSYEVAKLLKEKGFDELTTFVWYQHLPVSLDCQNLVNKKARDYFYRNETTEHNSSYKNSRHKPEYIHGDIFSCPTHQMAMKWLREKHTIHISANPIVDYVEDADGRKYMENVYWAFDFMNSESGEFIETPNNDYQFGTYEEAVEAAFKYCLTNLI